jgi:nucleoside-diphosphate-sugar epimerase
MKILFTGASGYFGSEIIKELYADKKAVVTLITRKYLPAYPKHTQIIGDIGDKYIYRKIKKNKFDLVIHCAGYVPKNSEEDIWSACKKGNVLATESLIKNIRCKNFIYISTCEVYGFQKGSEKIAEDCISNPISNYAKSKLLAENKCRELSRQKNIKLCVLRFTTIFGPDDKINRAIPNFIESALTNQDLKVVGSGKDKRDYLFIKDAVNAVILVINNFKDGIFNVSSGKGIAIVNLARNIKKFLGSKSKIKFIKKTVPKSAPSKLVFDNSSFIKNFNFRVKYPIKIAISLIAKLKRCIFFDLDGTLIDINDRWYTLHRDLSKIYQFRPIPKKKYIKLKRAKKNEMDIIKKTNILSRDINSYIKRRIKLIEFDKYLRKDKLKPGVSRLLKKLKNFYTLILVTKRKNKKHCLKEIKYFGIKIFFSKIIIADCFSKEQAIKNYLNDSVCKFILLIGDTEDDYIIAKNLGIKCVLVSDGVRNKKYLLQLKPDYLADNINGLKLVL